MIHSWFHKFLFIFMLFGCFSLHANDSSSVVASNAEQVDNPASLQDEHIQQKLVITIHYLGSSLIDCDRIIQFLNAFKGESDHSFAYSVINAQKDSGYLRYSKDEIVISDAPEFVENLTSNSSNRYCTLPDETIGLKKDSERHRVFQARLQKLEDIELQWKQVAKDIDALEALFKINNLQKSISDDLKKDLAPKYSLTDEEQKHFYALRTAKQIEFGKLGVEYLRKHKEMQTFQGDFKTPRHILRKY